MGGDGVEVRPAIDFDLHSEDYSARTHEILDNARERCPIAWTDAQDGYWVATRYEDVATVLTDYERFSSEHDLPEELTGFPSSGSGFRGVIIPESPLRFVPSEADPPLSSEIRRIELPFFTARALKEREPQIVAATDAALDAVMQTGRIEFQRDLATPVPFRTALSIIGLDPDEWPLFAHAATMVHTAQADADYPWPQIREAQSRVTELIARRRVSPRDDVTSRLVHTPVQDRPLTDQQVGTILNGLVFAGANTVTSAVLFALLWLDGKTEMRERMIAEPTYLKNAIEEFLRVQSPATGSGRNVVQSDALQKQPLERGDRVFASITAANRDPALFECPHDVRVDRANAIKHVAFGAGVHRCTGAGLARLEMKVMLERVLTRIPDYKVDLCGVRRPRCSGKLNTYTAVPATFGVPGSAG
jgi:cytochrome P450